MSHSRLAAVCLLMLGALLAGTGEPPWRRLSSSKGALPVPGPSTEQTGDLVARLDKASPATHFVISFRVTAPALCGTGGARGAGTAT